METVYDLDLNKARDLILLYRGKRVRHQWTSAEARKIERALNELIPKMVPEKVKKVA